MTKDKNQMRAEFEKWAESRGYQRDELDRSRIGIVGPEYYNLNTEMAWQSWQAARASAPQGVPANIRRAIQSALEGMSDALHVAGRDNKDEEDALDWLAASPQPAAQKDQP